MEKEIIKARDFNETEIKEISRYILSNTPYSALEQVFIFTEKPLDKCSNFITIYRLINSCFNYVQNEETKKKLDKLLLDTKEIQDKIYNLILKYNENIWGEYYILKELNDVLRDEKNRILLDNFTDVFLVFSERQTFQSLDKISGIETEEVEGSEIVDKLVEVED